MAKKRRSDSTRLDEVDRSMYTTFCGAANSLSQLYTQAMHQQKLSFQAGERHSLDKLYNWILRQQENGSRMTLGDITAYLENELEYTSEESPLRSMNSDHQPKNASVFSNALSSPVRRSLQHYHLSQGADYPNNATPSLNTHRSTENGFPHHQNRESNAPTSNDSSMDMHADSPAHESSY